MPVNPKYLRDDLDSLFSHVIEECGEVIAASGKTLRWGPHSYNPEINDGPTNVAWLYRELVDLKFTLGRLIPALEDEFNLHDGC